jgi:hypothetical protein
MELKIIIICLVLAVIIVFLLAIKAYRLNKEIETNKLFIDKSENELRLFFQFETVLEELVKLMRKTDSQTTKLIDGQDDIRLILECTLKK